jgi:hypothetical protein
VLPAVDKIGVGWFSTISAGFLLVGTAAVWVTASYGAKWRGDMDKKKVKMQERKAAEDAPEGEVQEEPEKLAPS